MEYLQEIRHLKSQILKFDGLLSDEKFMNKAPEKVIELNKKKLADFNRSLEQKSAAIYERLNAYFNYKINSEIKINSNERIEWHVQYLRDNKINSINYLNKQQIEPQNVVFNDEYFNLVYNKSIIDEEIAELMDNLINYGVIKN